MCISRIFRAQLTMLACLIAFVGAGMSEKIDSANADKPDPAASANAVQPSADARIPDQGPVVLKVADRSVNFGGRFRLRGRTGNPYQGQVQIQSLVDGSWKTLRKVKTDQKGRYQTRVRARRSTSFRTKTNDGRSSDHRRVSVIGHIRMADSERYVRIGRKLLIRGVVLPRGPRTVKVRVRGEGVITTRSRANGRFRVRWQPRSAGDFSYRVRALPTSISTGDSSLRRRFSALRPGHASYYGPGLYGNGVACGGTLLPGTRGVAHKYLPCGTRVVLQYGNRTVVARVIDRGPYIAGRDWDLTEQTRNDLGFGGVGVVWTNR